MERICVLDFQSALKKILDCQEGGKTQWVDLSQAQGRVLGEDVISPMDLPLFDNSAMDGFAVLTSDLAKASLDHPVSLNIIETIWAGKTPERVLRSGDCVRIMTGARIPHGASAVVMKEKVSTEKDRVLFSAPAKPGENIRYRGEEIHRDDLLLKAGIPLTPAAIGLLTSVGMHQVAVVSLPKVAIIPTGSELVSPGGELSGSQIYESNSYALAAAVAQMGLLAQVFPPVRDDPPLLREILGQALATFSHVLVTGGVSVGDFDHSRNIFSELGVAEIFWQVAQKPGKPLYFGRHGKTSVFGLPGNPASTLTCFYEYVFPALKKSSGHLFSENRSEGYGCEEFLARLENDVKKKPGLMTFLRGVTKRSSDGSLTVRVLPGQESHKMSSFAASDVIILTAEFVESLPADSWVRVHKTA
jgi:molybdopterin molybdotransferase